MNGVVVDTSVWIDYFGGREVPPLDHALKQGTVILPPIVVAELVSWTRRPRQRAALIGFLEELPLCDDARVHWIRVGELRRQCP